MGTTSTQWSTWTVEARGLSRADLERHAPVSTGNRHQCRQCFTCACAAVLREIRRRESADKASTGESDG
jgi:hypothetical protein